MRIFSSKADVTRVSIPVMAWLLLWLPLGAAPAVKDLTYADLLFKQKEYNKAAEQYQWFVKQNPAHEQLQTGWFQLGECYRLAGRIKEAKAAFESLIVKYREGPQVGEASYRLGILNFGTNEYSAASVDFELASREVASDQVKYQAKYYNARSLQLLQLNDRALALYDQVIRTNPGLETNHFHEKSLLEAARIYSEKGDYDLAHQHFETLIKTAATDEIREEATVRSGLAAVTAGKIDEGETLLKASGEFRSNSPWKAVAEVGKLFAAYARRDFDRVILIYQSGTVLNSLEEFRPKALLTVAEAFRAKGDEAGSHRLYTLVESRFPGSPEALEAGFRRLTALYRVNSEKLPAAVKKYTGDVKTHNPEDSHIDKAWLMLGEWHFFQAEKGVKNNDPVFAKTQYQNAAAAYLNVRAPAIEASHLSTMLFHQSWACLETADLVTGAQTVTSLLEKFPDSPLVPQALAKRGEIYLGKEDFASALADFQHIIDKYADSVALEVALDRKGRIYAHKRILPEMVVAYEELLWRFPETRGRAEAHFWIGDGYFEQAMFKESVPHFAAARQLDPEAFANKSGIRIIIAHYSLKQIPEMTQAARLYIQTGRDAGVPTARQKTDKALKIPEHVLLYLGKKLSEKGEFEDADFFLGWIVNLEAPEKTKAEVWKEWADNKLKLKEYATAISGYDRFLVQCHPPVLRGDAYVNRGKAQFALAQYDQARSSAYECLRVVKQGRVNAEARILLGELSVQGGDLETAAREYDLVSQIFDDPQITPQALGKAAELYQKTGKKEDLARVEEKLAERTSPKKRNR